MAQRNASAAAIGAGDFIGAAIAKKFAAKGFTVFAGRRRGEKLAPLVAEIEAAGGHIAGHALDARKEDEIAAFPAGRRRGGAARNLHLQHRRQRQFSAAGYDRAGVPQGLGDGLLCRLPLGARGGAADAAARAWQYLRDRRDGRPARRRRLRRLRQRQVRVAGGGAKRGPRTRAQGHPCRASDHRRRRRYRLGARAHPRARGRGG